MPSVPTGTLCILGAGGPVGVMVYQRLKDHYRLRLADRDSIAAIIDRPHRPKHPRWATPPDAPHEWVTCDVTNPEDVDRAIAGCDAVINLTVVRSDPVPAFGVNVYGAFNILRSALRHRVKRVIHSGPWHRINHYESDYRYEYRITSDAPYSSGTIVYPLTKGLSLKVVDAFADHHDIDVMTFLISRIRVPDDFDGRDDDIMISFTVSWEDLAEAFYCGLNSPYCPSRHETYFIAAPLPFEKFDLSKEKRILGWEAKDRFEPFYTSD